MKLLLMDDHDLFSISLKIILEQKENIEKVILLKDSKNLEHCIKNNHITLVLLDIRLGKENGLEIGKELKAKHPEILLFFLTGFDLMDYHYQAYAIGAEGFFDKGIEPEVLYEAINEAVKNPRAFWRKKKPPKHPLSNREVEVLMLLSKGQTRFEIAEKLDISKRTVDAFIQRIYNKLGVNTAVEATVKGIQLGIIRVL